MDVWNRLQVFREIYSMSKTDDFAFAVKKLFRHYWIVI